MPGFRFPLQRLLDLRRRHEDEARCQLAQSQREVSRHQERLSELRTACAEARQDAVPSAGRSVQPGLLLNNDLHLARLRLLATAQQSSVDRWQQQEQAHRSELVEKARNREVLERLRERRRSVHVADQQRREGRRLDEAGAMAFAHNHSHTAASDAA